MKPRGRIVYSTDAGRHCPECGRPATACVCKQRPAPQGDGTVRLQRQTKGRNGKPVIVVSGLALPPDELKRLARRLKAKCAVGGTIEGANIVIQGDKRDIIKAELEALEYRVK